MKTLMALKLSWIMMYNFYQPHLKIHLKIDQKLLHQTFDEVYRHMPKEYGGIFLGKIVQKDSCAEIQKILMPKHFKSSKNNFKRYSENLNQEISKYYHKSNQEIIYLGEWHSHPLNPPIPSTKDYDAMLSISLHETIALKTPILLIISYTIEKSFSPRFYVMFNKKFYPYEQI